MCCLPSGRVDHDRDQKQVVWMVDYRPKPHALSIHSYKSDVLQVKEDLQVKILLKEIRG